MSVADDVMKLTLISMAAMEVGHIGFCFGDYKIATCRDCPTEKECLELFLKEQKGE